MTPPTSDPTRRRNENSRRSILDAVVALIAEVGYERASIEQLARRAGVGKQTVYRRWPSKGAVTLEALVDRLAPVVSFPDTGDILEDLRVQLTEVTALFTTDLGALYRALAAAAQSDAALSQEHFDRVITPALVACQKRFEVARRRGEIRCDVDVPATVDLLYGFMYYRLLLHARPLEAAQIDAALRAVSRGIF